MPSKASRRLRKTSPVSFTKQKSFSFNDGCFLSRVYGFHTRPLDAHQWTWTYSQIITIIHYTLHLFLSCTCCEYVSDFLSHHKRFYSSIPIQCNCCKFLSFDSNDIHFNVLQILETTSTLIILNDVVYFKVRPDWFVETA